MQLKSVPRIVLIPATFALGAISFGCLRGPASSQAVSPPVEPSQQALDMQSAFEQVADKLRPSVVFIKSRQSLNAPSGFRQGQFDPGDGDDNRPGDGDNNSPFGYGFPGSPRGGQQYRMTPQAPRRAYASGSGVIVRSDGYILTNDHVVNGADKVTVKLQDGREFTGQVKRDFKGDLALIKIDADNLPAAELADSDKARVGQWAIAFGSPFGLSDTMTVGVVSALHREQEIGDGQDGRVYPSLIQTDASINPGNSGGPLVDIYGRVVGINVAIESPSGGNVGIGFAIPANTARYVMDQLITRGAVTRGYLGLAPKTLTYDEQQRYGVKAGALVMSVQDGTPASKAGFQVEDVIVRFDGNPVENDGALRDMVARVKPGTTVPVVVRRGGEEHSLDVTIGSAPDQQVAQNAQPSGDNARGKLGVRVGNASDPDVRKQFNLNDSVTSGAVVAEVVPGSPASEAGFQPGDVIVRLNGKTVDSPEKLTEIVGQVKGGDAIPVVLRRGNQTVLAQINLE
jgi:serine protease Do